VVNMLKQGIKPLDILTKKAFENAITVVIALGGSTNAVLHLLAIAHAAKVKLTIDDFTRVGKRVPPEMVLPVFVSVVFFIALLIGYPWYILSAGSLLYLLSLPAGWKSYRDHARKAAEPAATASAGAAPATPASPFAPVVSEADEDERPPRLN